MEELKNEIIKQTGEVYKENLENLTVPTSKSLGNNLGEMIEGIFGWFGVWGKIQKIKQEEYIKRFKQNVEEELRKIDENKLMEPKMNIIGPTLETAKFYYDEEYYQEMFARILAKACNREYENDIHPAFVETIKQLTPLDAKVITSFKENSTYPIAEIKAINSDDSVTPCKLILSDFKNIDNEFTEDEKIKIATTIENLCRLGILLKNKSVIELKYDYEKFRNDFIYKSFAASKDKESKIEIIKYRIELTSYGQAFFNICIKE